MAAATSGRRTGSRTTRSGWLVRVASRRMADRARSAGARRRREDVAASWSRAAARPGAGPRRHAGRSSSCAATRAVPGVRRRPHAAGPGRPHHPRDRGRVPRPRGDHGPAHQPGQAHRGRVRSAVRAPRRGGRRRAARAGAPGGLPRLQRGLRVEWRPRPGPHRPGVGGHPPRAPAPRALARRARGVRAARTHAADRGAPDGPGRGRRGPRPSRRAGPRPVGPTRSSRKGPHWPPRRWKESRSASTPCRPPSPRCTMRHHGRRTPTGNGSSRCTRYWTG